MRNATLWMAVCFTLPIAAAVSQPPVRVNGKLAAADLTLKPVPEVYEMNGEALLGAYLEERVSTQFQYGSFSPDGKFFAVTTGDPDARVAWIYDLSSRRLTRVVPTRSGELTVISMGWRGDTLYVESGQPEGSSPHFYAATANRAETLNVLPPAGKEALKQRLGFDYGEARSSRFIVNAIGPHHGNFSLTANTVDGRKPFSIADGSWELQSFALLPQRSLVSYPTQFYPAIVVFDLNNRQRRETALPVRAEKLLAVRSQADGLMIAYSTVGPCIPDNPGESSSFQPRYRPYDVCFTTIPFLSASQVNVQKEQQTEQIRKQPQNALEPTLAVEPGRKLNRVDSQFSALPNITPMNCKAAMPALARDTGPREYGPGSFSPDGTRFAVAGRTGESGYVCVYRVPAHQIDFVAVPPEQTNEAFSISSFTWVDDSLYAEAPRSDGGISPLKITPGGVQRLNVLPGCESLPPGQPCVRPRGSPGLPPIPQEVQNAYFRQLAKSLGVAANSHFIVTADNSRSVDVYLVSQTGNGHDVWVIDKGSDNLKSFLLEGGSSILLYPTPGQHSGGIVAYNLNTRQSRKVDLASAQNLRLLDSISAAAGTLVAYTVDGPCVTPDSASGKDPQLLPRTPMPISVASSVCFVEIPNSSAK